MNNVIAISDLRKKFGEIEAALPYVDFFTITKKGKPFATITATNDVKKSIIKNCAGLLKNTDLDNNNVWKEALKKKSRKKAFSL